MQNEELVARAQAGDRDAFASLVERYWVRLQRWLTCLCGSAQEAEDLTAEPALYLEDQENQRLFERACARLPPLFRAAFLLWTQEGFSQAQLAEALETTEETARWRVYKARQILMKELRSALDQAKP